MLKLLMFVCAKRLMDTVSSNEASLCFERTVVCCFARVIKAVHVKDLITEGDNKFHLPKLTVQRRNVRGSVQTDHSWHLLTLVLLWLAGYLLNSL